MSDDPVMVPPEVAEELERLYEHGEVDPKDREGATRLARERDLEAAARWLDQVGDGVYADSVEKGFVAGDEV